jgi:hypothetical protein
MPRRSNEFVTDVGVDVRPIREFGADLIEALGVGIRHIPERLIAENNAPSKGVSGPIALVEVDAGPGEFLGGQDRRVETTGASADNCDVHGGQGIG